MSIYRVKPQIQSNLLKPSKKEQVLERVKFKPKSCQSTGHICSTGKSLKKLYLVSLGQSTIILNQNCTELLPSSTPVCIYKGS